ncbi:MAG: prepilin peptidase [bacterium]
MTTYFILTILVISGLFLGCFLNMLIYRLPYDMVLTKDIFKCRRCKKIWCVLDFIPLLSYLINRGKCRYCKKSISCRYFFVELITPIVLLVVFFQYPAFSWLFFKFSFFYIICIIIFFTDFETYIIPNHLTYLCIGIGLLESFFVHQYVDRFVACGIGYGIYYLIGKVATYYYKKESMGGGDMKLAAGIGALWGMPIVLLSIYLSFFVAVIVVIPLLLLKIKSRKDHIPFGPAIIIASIISLHYSEEILAWWFYV